MSTSERPLGRTRPPNRLAGQTSPYLLQHAHNPVDWWPWGPDAFAEARRREVPIFLSIGYSTCYWCHVMERESFEDEATARLMNSKFVCIKLDREERPDVDDAYMAAVQAYSGRGGWPMSVFIEPAGLRPFYAGTYYPPEPRHNMPGFSQVIEGLSAAWVSQRADVMEQAEALAGAVKEQLEGGPTARRIGAEQVATAVSSLVRMHDRTNGGFGGAPKFPQPVFLELLMEFRTHAGDDQSREAADAVIRSTLDRMGRGGMFDQVGGGFHRYSVDEKWLVPHFEKMLYDNAQLAPLYAQAGAVYGDASFTRVARRTLDYVLREMTSPGEAGGGFLSAQDAETNHREGESYLWTEEEIEAGLPAGVGALALDVYGVKDGPNFRDPHHPKEPMKSVLYLRAVMRDLAGSHGLTEGELAARLDAINAGLLAVRDRRPQPSTDDKVLAAWNGLMITAMCRCGKLLDDPKYIDAAERAARFILGSMRGPEGRLLRSWRQGRAQIEGFLEDYAMVARGLFALHAAGCGGGLYAREGAALLKIAAERFAGPAPGFYFDAAAADQVDLFIRPRSLHDGAMPSGSSTLVHAQLDAFGATSEATWLHAAGAGLAGLSGSIAQSPLGMSSATRALLRMLVLSTQSREVLGAAVEGAPEQPAASEEVEAAEVTVFASADRLSIGEGEEGARGLMLRVQIEEGLHLAAPGRAADELGLIPLKVHIVSGGGVEVYAKYPEGQPLELEGEDGLRVYTGTIEFAVVVARPAGAEWSGRPLLAVTYQACTETACLAPVTTELDVALDRA
ncbi:MAG: DUF255 domain-containing protein [Phycisphaerales bacterium]|nr:DUF255 domain-containing protein [Phycisphaerales bacterium]